MCVGTDDYNAIINSPSKNGWTSHLVSNFSKDDFQSLDEADALALRSLDGSFPRKFGRIKSTSALIDAGIDYSNIGVSNITATYNSLLTDFPFLKQDMTGEKRDLGAYEFKDYTATGINLTEAAGKTAVDAGHVYNLAGQRVQPGYKGIVIKDGRKYLAR